MILHLMRHGIAIDREDPACPPENERTLTPEGVVKTEAVARGMRRIEIEPEIVLSSPLVRAVQTAEIACDALGLGLKKLLRSDALKPGANPAQLFDELARLKAEEVLCCGHAPNLDEILAYALGSHGVVSSMKKAGVTSLEIESFTPPHAFLLGYYAPRVLRKVAD